MPHTDNHFARWSSAELFVAANFAERGYSISLPTAPCGYDLIVDTGLLYRIQVKSLGWRPPRQRKAGKGDRGCYAVGLLDNHQQPCAAGAFDVLAAVCGPQRIYLIPVEMLKHPANPDHLVKALRIKLPGDRADSQRAAARWEPYLLRWELPSGAD